MMKTTLLGTLLLLIMATVATAQDNSEFERRQQQKQQKESTLQQAVAASASAKALKAKVDAQESDVILEAAKTGDKSLIPYLKLLATGEFKRTIEGSAAFEAHVALVKLGEEEASTEIFAELDSESPRVQNAAIAKFALVGNKVAYKKLYELLDDIANRSSETTDVAYGSKSRTVMVYLGRTVDNPPLLPNGNVNYYDISVWKAWFAKNKHLIE